MFHESFCESKRVRRWSSRKARRVPVCYRFLFETMRFRAKAEVLAKRASKAAENSSKTGKATEAANLLTDIKSNPELMKAACDQVGDRLSGMYLGLAESFLKKGQPQQAVYYLERIVQTLPNSHQAEAARVRLAQIQSQPTRSVDFKKP